MRKHLFGLLIVSSVVLTSPLVFGRSTEQQTSDLSKKAGAGDPQALVDLQQQAGQGDAQAQFFLGSVYFNGKGILEKPSEALQWFRKSAEKGFAPAQNVMGIVYLNGGGVAKDAVVASQWLQKAAEQGYAPAQIGLGFRYRLGQGVAQDFVQAYKWWTIVKAISKPTSPATKTANDGLDELAKRMSPEQIAKARQEANAWIAAHPDKP